MGEEERVSFDDVAQAAEGPSDGAAADAEGVDERGSSGEEAAGAASGDVAALKAELSELNDRYLRKQADFENYRRRVTREREEIRLASNQQLLLDLTSIIDDFERAIRSSEESRDFDAFHGGVELIERQLTGMLERKWGLTRFDSAGEPFDPQKHEAVTAEERDDTEEQIVLEEYQKGYLLGDRVLRPAKVKVSTPRQ